MEATRASAPPIHYTSVVLPSFRRCAIILPTSELNPKFSHPTLFFSLSSSGPVPLKKPDYNGRPTRVHPDSGWIISDLNCPSHLYLDWFGECSGMHVFTLVAARARGASALFSLARPQSSAFARSFLSLSLSLSLLHLLPSSTSSFLRSRSSLVRPLLPHPGG